MLGRSCDETGRSSWGRSLNTETGLLSTGYLLIMNNSLRFLLFSASLKNPETFYAGQLGRVAVAEEMLDFLRRLNVGVFCKTKDTVPRDDAHS